MAYEASVLRRATRRLEEERARRAGQVAQALERRYLEGLVGRTLSVLFEQDEDGCSKGHAPNYVEVRLPEAGLHNVIRDVTVTGVGAGYLMGE